MGVKSRLISLLQRLEPDGLDEPVRVRARFFVGGWVGVGGINLLSTLLYAWGHAWPQLTMASILVVSGVLMLVLFKRGCSLTTLGHASLAALSLNCAATVLIQTPADYTNLAVLLIMPMMAGFVLGPRAASVWMGLTLALGSFTIYAMDHGWNLPFADPSPTSSHIVNFGIGLYATWFFARMFESSAQEGVTRLRDADLARRAFLANVSHEIRTPMNGVLGMTELMLLETNDPAQREQLQTIQRSGRTLVALINDLLDQSKIEAGRFELDVTDFSLERLLEDLRSLWGPLAGQKGLTLKVLRDDAVPDVLHGDGRRLGQVLNNLLGNALKFTEQGGVTLAVRAAGERVRFEVTDTGIGIAPHVASRLFETFRQADAATTRRFGGTGLGLALSQQLVMLMGGRITIDSAPGRGSTFAFEVALPRGEALASTFVAPQVATRVLSVLVVDDNAINLKLAMQLVRKAGCEAEGAVNGRVALEVLQRKRFDLVLMDCHMPEMDGFEATERIRASGGELSRLPIVALTASAMPEDLEACRRAGMNEVLTKPISFEQLRLALARTPPRS